MRLFGSLDSFQARRHLPLLAVKGRAGMAGLFGGAETESASAVLRVGSAIVAPITRRISIEGLRRSGSHNGGAYDRDRKPIPLAIHQGASLRHEPDAVLEGEVGLHLAGTYLFGGWYREHFGHFLVESLGRLWAYPDRAAEIQGIVYIDMDGAHFDKGSGAERPLPFFVPQLLEVLGIDKPVLVLGEATAFETLLIPRQIDAPRTEARDIGLASFMDFCASARRHPKVLAAPISRRIYVSRSALRDDRAKIVLETAIEEGLAAEGYDIIHPETLSIPEQIALYAGAEKMVFAEGSAILLAAMVARPGQEMAIIGRRDPIPAIISRRLGLGGARKALEINAVRQIVLPRDPGALTPGIRRNGLPSLLDFARIRGELVRHGFITGAWQPPSSEVVAQAVAATRRALQARYGVEF